VVTDLLVEIALLVKKEMPNEMVHHVHHVVTGLLVEIVLLVKKEMNNLAKKEINLAVVPTNHVKKVTNHDNPVNIVLPEMVKKILDHIEEILIEITKNLVKEVITTRTAHEVEEVDEEDADVDSTAIVEHLKMVMILRKVHLLNTNQNSVIQDVHVKIN
jgi:uncharacterized membrane-anchored protein